ncbi:hypothetical protein LINGRAHAP2_LOCUS855, partial [Linum grandiflorum]
IIISFPSLFHCEPSSCFPLQPLRLLILSKLLSDSLREAIGTIITRAQEKPRKITE